MEEKVRRYTKAFPARLGMLYSILLWIRQHAKEANFSKKDLRKVELACEEALMNVIRHAYKNQRGEVELQIHVLDHKEIEIVIKDYGPSFNPLLVGEKINRTALLEERREGGLGIFLMQKYMDEVNYLREDPYNVLTLKKIKTSP